MATSNSPKSQAQAWLGGRAKRAQMKLAGEAEGTHYSFDPSLSDPLCLEELIKAAVKALLEALPP